MVIIDLDWGVDSQRDWNLFDRATRSMNHEGYFLSRLDAGFDTQHIKSLASVESQRRGIGAFLELARQHSHSHKVAAMNTFKALRNDRFDTKQPGPFCGPITRASSAILLTREDHEGHTFRLITHRSIVDARSLAGRLINRNATFNSRHHQVFDSHIGKRA